MIDFYIAKIRHIFAERAFFDYCAAGGHKRSGSCGGFRRFFCEFRRSICGRFLCREFEVVGVIAKLVIFDEGRVYFVIGKRLVRKLFVVKVSSCEFFFEFCIIKTGERLLGDRIDVKFIVKFAARRLNCLEPIGWRRALSRDIMAAAVVGAFWR